MRKLLVALLCLTFLSSGYSQVIDSMYSVTNELHYVYPTTQRVISLLPYMDLHKKIEIDASIDPKGGWFIVHDSTESTNFKPDGVLVLGSPTSSRVAVRISDVKTLNFEWFGCIGDGVTENYYAFQKMAAYATLHKGTTLLGKPGATYNINVYKAGTPKLKTNITQRDSIYVDSSGVTNDTIIYTVYDTTTTLTNSYTPNNITDILWLDPQYLTINGNGAKVHLNGAMNRVWTHSASNGAVHQSAYSTVIPFSVAFGNHVTIENFEIDGDNQETTETTPVNEGQGYGITIRGTDFITLRHLYIHNSQTDGLYIEGTGAGTPGPNGGKIFHASTNANVEGVEIRYCGRQALTIGALHIGHFLNCKFNSTGDTTGMGSQPFAMKGYAPQKGLDIEPIYERTHSTLIRTDEWTSDITFTNCEFKDNRGGSIAMSHAYTARDISFIRCPMDNSKFNRFYNIISNLGGVTFNNCDINTGTGAMYLTRDNGGEQRVDVTNCRITSGGTGFITGSAGQYGVIVENNWIIGNHDTTFKSYFPMISSNAIFMNNHIVLDSALYTGTGQRLAAQIYTGIAEGNTWISQMDTLPGRTNYAIIYLYNRTVDKENYTPRQAVRPYGGWDVAHSDFTTAKVGIGAIQVANGGFGKPEVKTYWLPAVPIVNPPGDTYKEGDVINITKPGLIGWDKYRCITGGDFTTGTPPVLVPVGPISATGATVYHNALIVAGSDWYVGRNLTSGGTSLFSHALLPNGGTYFTKSVNDTGMVVFKSPLAFTNTGEVIIKGTMYMRGKGNVNFTVSSYTLGNHTFVNNSLVMNGDSLMQQAIKVRWLKDANNDVYLAFFDSTTTLIHQTEINFESISLMASTQSYVDHATQTWIPTVVRSLTGYTATVVSNSNSVDWTTGVYNKPTIPAAPVNADWNAVSGLAQIQNKPTIPAQISPIAGSGISISGSYPNLTFSSTGTTIVGTGTTYARQIASALGSNTITENFPIDRLTTAQSLTSQQLKLHAIWIPNDTVITGAKYFVGTSGVYTASNYNGVALYSYNTATGVATLVASSTNDGTIWTALGWSSKAFSTPYSATKGAYFVVTLYSSSAVTTTPTLATCVNTAGATIYSADFSNSAKLVSILSAQTALPSTISMSATATTTIQPYLALY